MQYNNYHITIERLNLNRVLENLKFKYIYYEYNGLKLKKYIYIWYVIYCNIIARFKY